MARAMRTSKQLERAFILILATSSLLLGLSGLLLALSPVREREILPFGLTVMRMAVEDR